MIRLLARCQVATWACREDDPIAWSDLFFALVGLCFRGWIV